jgi:hypothetical protein
MIAFASVFLMKVTTKWNRILGLNVEQAFVWSLLERMIHLLKTSVTSTRHLLYHIAAGLEKMLKQHNLSRQMISAASQNATTSAEHSGVVSAIPVQQLSPSSLESWDPFAAAAMMEHGTSNHGQFNDLTIMNNNMIYESFGTESAHDVYNLLSSQFSY